MSAGSAGGDRLVKALGWASVGLGVPQLVAPDRVLRAVGLRDGPGRRTVTRVVGGRELIHAAGLLAPGTRRAWAWTRVAGDAMDVTLVGRALVADGRKRSGRTVVAPAALAGITALDVYAAISNTFAGPGGRIVVLSAATTVRKDPAEVHEYWKDLQNLPAFMAHVERVTPLSPTRSHWAVKAPFGRTVEWDADMVAEEPGRRLAWRSVDGSRVDTTGTVTFTPAPGGRGTEVHVTLSYSVPGGRAGRVLARVAGEDPHQQLDDDLRRFKQVLETGEVVRSEGAPGGRMARREFPQRPARPLSPAELAEVTL